MRLKWLFLQASIYSLWAQVFIIFDRDYILKQSIINTTETDLKSQKQISIVRDVTKITRILKRRAPWNPMCLNLAYVTKKILKENDIESTFRLGFIKGQPTTGKMDGHAWVTINDKLVTGWMPNLKDYVEMTHPKQIIKIKKAL